MNLTLHVTNASEKKNLISTLARSTYHDYQIEQARAVG